MLKVIYPIFPTAQLTKLLAFFKILSASGVQISGYQILVNFSFTRSKSHSKLIILSLELSFSVNHTSIFLIQISSSSFFTVLAHQPHFTFTTFIVFIFFY